MNNEKTKNLKNILHPEVEEIILNLLEKYEIIKKPPNKTLEEMSLEELTDEASRIFESMEKKNRILEILFEISSQKKSWENAVLVVKEEFSLPEESAINFINELKEKVIFHEPRKREEKKESDEIKIEEPKIDKYRESIE